MLMSHPKTTWKIADNNDEVMTFITVDYLPTDTLVVRDSSEVDFGDNV